MGMTRLETERLILRTPTLPDAPATYKYLAHENVVRYLATVPWPYLDGAAEKYLGGTVLPGIENGTILAWALTIKEQGDEMVGFIDIQAHDDKPTWGSRGFWLAEKFWEKGYMREATEAVNEHVFIDLEIEGFEARNAVANTASGKLKANAVGRLIEVVNEDTVLAKNVPTEVWEIHRDDWLEAQAQR